MGERNNEVGVLLYKLHNEKKVLSALIIPFLFFMQILCYLLSFV